MPVVSLVTTSGAAAARLRVGVNVFDIMIVLTLPSAAGQSVKLVA